MSVWEISSGIGLGAKWVLGPATKDEGENLVRNNLQRVTGGATRCRLGVALIYCMVCLLAVVAIVAYAVEVGRVKSAKTELQTAADAAVRVAIKKFMISEMSPSGYGSVRADAKLVASRNNCDGESVTLLDSEIQFIKWNAATKTWTGPYTGAAIMANNANAIRVIPSRTLAKGNPIPLYFGSAIGMTSCDISNGSATTQNGKTVEAIAYVVQPAFGTGFVGLDFIDVKNNIAVSSRNFATGQTGPGGVMASNGPITAKNNSFVGSVMLGPAGSVSIGNNSTITGRVVLPEAMNYPSPGTPPSAAMTPPPTLTNLAGGVYVWNNLTMTNNKTLSFTGPATVWITGNVDLSNNCTIQAYNGIPSNLKIYMTSPNGTFTTNNNTTISCQIYGPTITYEDKNNAVYYGSGIFKSITSKNNTNFVSDESTGGSINTPFVIVK